MFRIQRSGLYFLSGVVAIGLVIRLLYLWEYSHSPFFDSPIVDAHSFLRQALLIAEGNWLGKHEPFWQPPLYIYFLALFCWISPDDYFVTIRLAQIALGLGSITLLFYIARQYFDPKTAKIALVIYSACGSVLYFEFELLAVPLEIFFNLLLLLTIMRANHVNSPLSWLIAGTICGLSVLTRPNILLFIVIFCLFLLSKRQWKQIALIILPIVACIVPVSLRNYTMETDLVLISSNGGINFFIGNSGKYHEKVTIRPGMRWDELVTKPVLEGHNTAAAKSDYFVKESINYIRENTLEYLYSLGEKLFLFWNGPEIKRNTNIYYSRNHSQILSLLLWDKWISFPFGIIAPLALLGMGATWQSAKKEFPILHIYIVSYMISVLLFFVTSRYRMPLIPILICFSALGAQFIYYQVISGAAINKIRILIIFVGLITLCNWNKAPQIETDAQLHFDLGEVALRKKQNKLSEKHSRQALQLDPNYNYARHNLAVSLFHQNELENALRIAKKSAAENPKRADTQLLLARIYWALNNTDLARTHFRNSLLKDPKNGMAHYYYGRFLYKLSEFSTAAIHLSKAIQFLPTDAWIHYDVGRAFHQANDLQKALDYYESSWDISPTSIAANAIGAIHLQQGQFQKARFYFEASIEKDSKNIEAKINMAILTIQTGSVSAGEKMIQRLLQLYPNSLSVRNAARAYNISLTSP
ncbi:MAG: tetratricopeptide repeat protein [Candidatus Latescibacterota bacterium]|nr:tetratricopeptide repeat protein [Candidatus Latescibacterota bacterium]